MNAPTVATALMVLACSYSAGCSKQRPLDTAASSVATFDSAEAGTDSAFASAFVQSFYDWYTPLANAESPTPAWWRVLTTRPEALDSNLVRALRADSAARAGVPTREVLNFDPILDSQDPCPRYEAVQTQRKNGAYFVTIKPLCADTTWQTQRPVVAISRAANRWRIVNVYYDKGDLMGLLCQFANADKRPQPRLPGC